MQFYKDDYKGGNNKKTIIIVIAVLLVIGLFFLLKKEKIIDKEPAFKEKIAEIAKIDEDHRKKDFTIPKLIKMTKPIIVSITTYDKNGDPLGQGSGFFINNKGHIISNFHVFAGANKAIVKTNFGKYKVTKYLAIDKNSDIILFKTTFRGPVLQRREIKKAKHFPKVGEKIVAIGNPMGLELSASDGIVSAIRKKEPFGKVLQITSPISPGSSGSPVLNLRGEIIGIATFQMLHGQNLNFAVPIEKALKLKSSEELLLSRMDSLGSSVFKTLQSPLEQGEFLVRQKDYISAIPYLKEVISNNPLNAKAHYYLGICLRETNSKNSISEFKRAIDIDPGLENIYYEMGLSYVEMNMLDGGLAAFKDQIRNNPQHFKALVGLASIYLLKNMYEKARMRLEEAQNIDESVEMYNLLGMAYFALSKDMDAINAFDRAIELDKNNPISTIGIVKVFIKVENWSLGIKYINRGLLANPNSLELHLLKGLLALGNEDVLTSRIELEIIRKSKLKDKYTFASKLQNAISAYTNGSY